MSTLSQAPDLPAPHRSVPTDTPERGGDRTRFWVSFVATGLVTAWSVVEVVSLLTRHTTGPELYGILVAVLSATAGIASLALVASGRKRLLATIAVLALWAVVALGGIAGTYAHIVGAPPGEGPVDPRPRPVSAPLIFTALGVVGGAALFYGQRISATRLGDL
jgi:hypothetical protein